MDSQRSVGRKTWTKTVHSVVTTVVLVIAVLSVARSQEKKPVGLEVTPSKLTIREGETAQLKVIVRFLDGSTEDVTAATRGTVYESGSQFSSQPIVKVDPDGLVTAVSAEGRARNTESITIVNKPYNLFTITSVSVIERDALYMSAPKTTLRVGETVQLTVLQKLPDGSTRDLTDPSTGTTYYTTSESRLIPEPDGRVTCIGTRGKQQESAIIGAGNGKLYGSIEFRLLRDGPGPSLEVIADKPVLNESEKTRLHVYKPLPNGGRQDVTATSTGTTYLILPDLTRYDPVRIDDTGLVSAPDSVKPFRSIGVIFFVRNEDKVGWIEITVLPRVSRK